MTHESWSVYLLRCGDGTLYCGIAKDVAARLEQHRAGKGARYTKGRGPLVLIFQESCPSRPDALRREAAIKRLSRAAKLELAGCPSW
ncbi:MAG TPA: GIY-YIG nuclease family protein [Holophagaceae bacterium]|nr:GIY-YIG nuclease family protein [Holophagaceae bacterium]